MQITLTDIEVITRLYDECMEKYVEDMSEWVCDEDNTGIAFPKTKSDVLYEVYCEFCKYKRNNR